MALILLGIGLFGAITATITSYLMTQDLRRVEAKVEAPETRCGSLRQVEVCAQPRDGSGLSSRRERIVARRDCVAGANLAVDAVDAKLAAAVIAQNRTTSINRILLIVEMAAGVASPRLGDVPSTLGVWHNVSLVWRSHQFTSIIETLRDYGEREE